MAPRNTDIRGKTLTQIGNDDWGQPYDDLPPSKQEVLRLRHKPLEAMAVNDLRLLINYGVGLPYTVPLAIEWLRRDPFVEGYHYPGDLLSVVFRTSAEFYTEHPDCWSQVLDIAKEAQATLDAADASNRPGRWLEDDFEVFLACKPATQKRKPKPRRRDSQ